MTDHKEEGFTLIELIVVIAILGIIGGVLTEGIILGLRTTDETDQRLGESIDAQLVSSYFVTDVQSAGAVSQDAGKIAACGGAPAPPGYGVVSLEGTDPADPAAGPSPGPVVHDASYVVLPTSGGRQLVRRYCKSGVLVGQQPVAQFLAASPMVSIACVPGACTPLPVKVTINLVDVSGYAFQLSATTRTTP